MTLPLNGLPASLTYNAGTGQVEGTPLSGDAGAYTINAIVSDGTSAPVTEEFTLTINPPAGDAPVRAVVDGDYPAGNQDLAWDGRDDGGRAVADGVYLYRLEAGGEIRGLRVGFAGTLNCFERPWIYTIFGATNAFDKGFNEEDLDSFSLFDWRLSSPPM